MFTGIIEGLGKVNAIDKDGGNVHFTVTAPFTQELKVDQSLAHNGTCLTVTEISGDQYKVTAIQETLDKTNLGKLKIGDAVNLERCTKIGARLDGHIVQGHVDTTGTCTAIEDQDGSTKYSFEYDANPNHVTVEKGSITINGVSLTVVDSEANGFSVCIIPFTQEHTTFGQLAIGDKVNLEFDIVGKYVAKLYGLGK